MNIRQIFHSSVRLCGPSFSRGTFHTRTQRRKVRRYRGSNKAILALALLASVSVFLPYRTRACGPFFTDAIFVYTKHPDFPLENFAAGKLGVLQTTYARSYLVAAYR